MMISRAEVASLISEANIRIAIEEIVFRLGEDLILNYNDRNIRISPDPTNCTCITLKCFTATDNILQTFKIQKIGICSVTRMIVRRTNCPVGRTNIRS